MSAEHLENFGQYGVGQQARLLDGVYAEAGQVTIVADPDPTAPVGSVVARLASGGQVFPAILRYVLGGTRVKVGMAMRIYLPSLPDGDLRLPVPFSFRDGSNNVLLAAQVSPTGSIRLRNTLNETGTLLAETSGPVITAAAWWHLEMWATFNGVGGCAVELRVEGVTKLNTTLAAVTAAGCAQVAPAALRTSNFVADVTMYIKDMMINNGLGTRNNSFVGTLTMFLNTTVSDIALNWTPSTGAAGYPILDNIPADDAQYIAAGTPPPAAYEGGLSNLPADITSIRAVMSQVRAQKVDGGDGNLQVSLVTGALANNGSNRPITAAMTYWRDIYEENPNTSAPYTPTQFDNSNLRISRTV